MTDEGNARRREIGNKSRTSIEIEEVVEARLLPLQHASSHDSGFGCMHAPIRRRSLVLILAVPKSANALKNDHIACWHGALAVAY